MADVRVLANKKWQSGTHEFESRSVPVGITTIRVSIDRADLDVDAYIQWKLELSQDAGVTWLSWGSAGASGKPCIDPATSQNITVSWFQVDLPNPSNENRRIRGSITLNMATKLGLMVTVN